MNHYVQVIESDTGKIVEELGPMSEHNADKIEAGLSRNLNHEKYFTDIVSDERRSDQSG